MQSGKNTVEAAKEKILNVNATALSGLNKVKATTQEKIEKMTTSDPVKKESAEIRKEEKIREAEADKQRAFNENAIHKEQLSHTGIGGQGVHQNKLGVPPGMMGGHNQPNDVSSIANQTGRVAGVNNTGGQTVAGVGAIPATGHVGGVEQSGVQSTFGNRGNPAERITGVHHGGVQTAMGNETNPIEQVAGDYVTTQTGTRTGRDQGGHEIGGQIY